MAKRRRKKISTGKYPLLIGAIVFLNLIGVGYGYWNDGLQMITSISTGKLDVEFESAELVKGGEIEEFVLIPSVSNNEIIIRGGVPYDYDEILQLNYWIRNIGTMPVKIDGKLIEANQREFLEMKIPVREFEYSNTVEARQFNE